MRENSHLRDLGYAKSQQSSFKHAELLLFLSQHFWVDVMADCKGDMFRSGSDMIVKVLEEFLLSDSNVQVSKDAFEGSETCKSSVFECHATLRVIKILMEG